LTGGGNIRLGILGSVDPYRQKLGGLNLGGGGDSTTSTDGVEFTVSKGARIFFGGEEETTKYQANNDFIVIETGSLKLSAPTTVENEELDGLTSEHIHTELVIARLVGGVRVGISVGFMVLDPSSTDEDLIEVLPWRTHTDIVLRTPDAVRAHTRSPTRRITAFGKKKVEVCDVCFISRLMMRSVGSGRIECEWRLISSHRRHSILH
jgi:hypothetical protein